MPGGVIAGAVVTVMRNPGSVGQWVRARSLYGDAPQRVGDRADSGLVGTTTTGGILAYIPASPV